MTTSHFESSITSNYPFAPEPLVSILLPARNAGRWITESVKSLLSQTLRAVEVLFIDNNSVDDTAALVKQMRDSRIIIVSQQQGNLVAALNAGLKLAKGTFIARQDADDISSPLRLELQLRHLQANPAVGLVGCDYKMIDLGGSPLKKVIVPRTHNEICEIARSRMPIAGGTIMGRKWVFDRLQGYDHHFDGELGEDYDFVLRALEITRVESVARLLYSYRYNNPDSMCGRAKYQYGPSTRRVHQRALERRSPLFPNLKGQAR